MNWTRVWLFLGGLLCVVVGIFAYRSAEENFRKEQEGFHKLPKWMQQPPFIPALWKYHVHGAGTVVMGVVLMLLALFLEMD